MTTKNDWRVWDDAPDYGQTLYRRAIGELPEMESSKATAALMKGLVSDGDRMLDVGCGAGHYLRSLRREILAPFKYVGTDATAGYIERARQAWKDDPGAEFQVGDAFSLPFPDASFDLAMSCNLFLHLPSIRKPMTELIRVAKRTVVIRTLVGDRSFRIQDVHAGQPPGDEFDDDGEPRHFNYYNIYSKAYVSHLLEGHPAVCEFRIVPDQNFNPKALLADAERQDAPADVTRILDSWQVNGCILQPWHFIVIEKQA